MYMSSTFWRCVSLSMPRRARHGAPGWWDTPAKKAALQAFNQGNLDNAVALAMLRGKQVEMPGRKHDNLPV